MGSSDRRRRAIAAGYRSGLEEDLTRYLAEKNCSFEYEKHKIEWIDHKVRKYTPDFVLENGIIIETKGRFTPDDRRKHLEIRKQKPYLDIRFVFTNSNSRLNKGSNTSYAMWCERHGFQYADTFVPEEWLKEPTKESGLEKEN